MEPRDPLPPGLLEFLREQDNPFDDFVQARRASGSFRQRHVPAINSRVTSILRGAIARYRLHDTPDQQTLTEDDLPRTGALVVLGKRGAGKTHLVHALANDLAESPATANNGAARIEAPRPGLQLVAPAHFEPHRPFTEYLLHELVRRWQDPESGDAAEALLRLADWFARRVCVQALFGMAEEQWIAHHVDGRISFWKAVLGIGTRGLADQKQLLIAALNNPQLASLAEVSRNREQELPLLRRIALDQLAATETCRTIAGQIRLGLYLELVELAFDPARQEVFEFLLDGFTLVDAKATPSREALVEELVSAIVELSQLFGEPIVFAFDALENLLGDPADEGRCHAFFRGLAEVIDSQRGIPIFLFAESGHWQQVQRHISSYALQRLEQGVPTKGFGSVNLVQMPAISVEALTELAARRLEGPLSRYYRHGIPENARLGPFCAADLARLARDDIEAPPLRQTLQALRSLYQRLVFGEQESLNRRQPGEHEPATEAAGFVMQSAKVLSEELKDVWQRELKAAKRKISTQGINTLAGQLLVGLEKWLTYLISDGASHGQWTCAGAISETVGEHPTYGQIVRSTWMSGNREYEQAIGLLTAQGAGMPRDLQAKLAIVANQFQRGANSPQLTDRPAARPQGRRAGRAWIDSLQILWPKSAEITGAAEECLPAASREIWNRFVPGELAGQVRLTLVSPQELAPWLALIPWEQALQEEGRFQREAMQHFLVEETQELFGLAAPHDIVPERKASMR